jgi:hypothetical protein
MKKIPIRLSWRYQSALNTKFPAGRAAKSGSYQNRSH